MIFDQLESEVKEIHSIHTKYEAATKLHMQHFDEKKSTYSDLSTIMEGISSKGSQFFKIIEFEIKEKVSTYTNPLIYLMF